MYKLKSPFLLLCNNRGQTCFSDTLTLLGASGAFKTLTFSGSGWLQHHPQCPADVNAKKVMFDHCNKICASVRFSGLYEYSLEMTIPNVV